MSDPRERAIQEALPLVRAPRFGALPELPAGGTRFVMAKSGLYLEAKSNAVHAMVQVSPVQTDLPLPFGDVGTFVTLAGGPLPNALKQKCIECARATLPNEWAGAVLWSGTSYELIEPPVLSSSPHRVTYQTAGINPYDVALDVHSHGILPAFFSAQDDRDDRSNPSPAFFAGVIGALKDGAHAFKRRAVVNGRFFSRNEFTGVWASQRIDDEACAENME